MTHVLQPFHLLVIALAGWLNRHQQAVIDYLIEENRVLKEQLEGQRLRFTDEQRIRLAVKAKALGLLIMDGKGVYSSYTRTVPYARWCGRGKIARSSPIPIRPPIEAEYMMESRQAQ
jgi:hypothetical protein